MFIAIRSRIASPGSIRHATSLEDVAASYLSSVYRSSYAVSPNEKINQLNIDSTDKLSTGQSSFGVFKESESDDVDVLVNNFTSPALARALRERETTLHNAAHLADTGNFKELANILRPFLKSSIDKRRNDSFEWDITNGLTRRELILIQRQLHRMPREVFQATSRRASVVIPLCNVSGECCAVQG